MTRFARLRDFPAKELEEYLKTAETLEEERTLSPGVGRILFTLRELKPINKNY